MRKAVVKIKSISNAYATMSRADWLLKHERQDRSGGGFWNDIFYSSRCNNRRAEAIEVYKDLNEAACESCCGLFKGGLLYDAANYGSAFRNNPVLRQQNIETAKKVVEKAAELKEVYSISSSKRPIAIAVVLTGAAYIASPTVRTVVDTGLIGLQYGVVAFAGAWAVAVIGVGAYGLWGYLGGEEAR